MRDALYARFVHGSRIGSYFRCARRCPAVMELSIFGGGPDEAIINKHVHWNTAVEPCYYFLLVLGNVHHPTHHKELASTMELGWKEGRQLADNACSQVFPVSTPIRGFVQSPFGIRRQTWLQAQRRLAQVLCCGSHLVGWICQYYIVLLVEVGSDSPHVGMLHQNCGFVHGQMWYSCGSSISLLLMTDHQY